MVSGGVCWGRGAVQHGKEWGQYETQGGLGSVCLPEPPAAFRQVWDAQAGLSAMPSPGTPPLVHSTPSHAPPPLLTHSLAHTSPLISAPGLEQLRNLRHLDVAYNLLERHRELAPLWLLTELRKVRTREPASCPPPPMLSWSAPLLI